VGLDVGLGEIVGLDDVDAIGVGEAETTGVGEVEVIDESDMTETELLFSLVTNISPFTES
jgi:hypothetical protein